MMWLKCKVQLVGLLAGGDQHQDASLPVLMFLEVPVPCDVKESVMTSGLKPCFIRGHMVLFVKKLQMKTWTVKNRESF